MSYVEHIELNRDDEFAQNQEIICCKCGNVITEPYEDYDVCYECELQS